MRTGNQTHDPSGSCAYNPPSRTTRIVAITAAHCPRASGAQSCQKTGAAGGDAHPARQPGATHRPEACTPPKKHCTLHPPKPPAPPTLEVLLGGWQVACVCCHQAEVEAHNPELLNKPRLLVVSKGDLIDDEMEEFLSTEEMPTDCEHLFISSATGKGIEELKDKVRPLRPE